MEDFAKFIINYIENTEIHGKKGWLPQLSGYSWKVKGGTDDYQQMIEKSRILHEKMKDALKQSSEGEQWFRVCDEIRVWGHMSNISPELSYGFKRSVQYLRDNDPKVQGKMADCSIVSERIAMSSKIYYFSDPLRWTIYDSRVAYAIHQLHYEYAKERNEDPETIFSDIPFCLPESHTPRRKRIFSVSQGCYGKEIKAKICFIWASYLHRIVAELLNSGSTPKPSHSISTSPRWELPHIEMVLFRIGDGRWVA